MLRLLRTTSSYTNNQLKKNNRIQTNILNIQTQRKLLKSKQLIIINDCNLFLLISFLLVWYDVGHLFVLLWWYFLHSYSAAGEFFSSRIQVSANLNLNGKTKSCAYF